MKEISRETAIAMLWEAGELSYKLSDPQKIIKKGILEDSTKISVVMCARRLGKTFLMLTMAMETCLKTPGSVVKYVFPKQKAAKRNIFPEIKKILADCPKHLTPEFKVADLVIKFKNGSEIQLAGCDNSNIENIRGGNSSLNIIDEAGFADDLTYAVRSVLGPTVKLTKGRTILVSTPSRSENHEFIQDWVLPYMAENRIKVFSIYDNPQFTDAIIKDALEDYPEGENDPGFRREYMCEIIRDVEKTILPSFTTQKEKLLVTADYTRPVYCDKYVALDIGGIDLTAVLFGFYDYENATLVIEREFVCDGTTNTAILAENIMRIEKELWTNPIDKSVDAPYKRIADNNNAILLTDLQNLHNLTFTKTKKDKKHAALNALDVAIQQERLIIHPSCEHLLYHAKMAEWNNAQTMFKRLKDSPSKKIRGGHADCLDALLYLHRNIVKSHNPFPSGYNKISGPNVFTSLHQAASNMSSVGKALEQMFKKKK
jgi:hypothetical protein